jgi:hypothetical protein
VRDSKSEDEAGTVDRTGVATGISETSGESILMTVSVASKPGRMTLVVSEEDASFSSFVKVMDSTPSSTDTLGISITLAVGRNAPKTQAGSDTNGTAISPDETWESTSTDASTSTSQCHGPVNTRRSSGGMESGMKSPISGITGMIDE